MSDFESNEKLTEDAAFGSADEESTIFSAPAEHRDRKKTDGKKRLIPAIASLLAVAVLVGGTIAVIKLIPEKEDEISSSDIQTIEVLALNSDDFKRVAVTNPNGTYQLYSETETEESEEGDATDTVNWYMEGYDKDMTSENAVSAIADAAASIDAIRTAGTKTAAECGLDTPEYSVQIETADESAFTITIGDESPDHTGVYLKLSTADTIYIVDSAITGTFNFTDLDLASTDSIPAVTVTSEMSGYTNDEGALASFDSLTISGTNFPESLVVTPNDDSALSAYAAYITTAPSKRIADKTDEVFALFTGGVAVTGAYAYDASASTLASLGLTNPDFSATVKIGAYSRSYHFKKQEDGSYAAIADDSKMVHKVAESTLGFIGYKTSDFYASWVFLQSIDELSNLTVTSGDTVYSFDIAKNEDENADANEKYIINLNGKSITCSYFQNFYQYFVGLSCSDYTIDTLSTEPVLSMIFTYSDVSLGQTTVAFKKASETKYQYSIDGIDMGKINSSDFNKIIKYAERVADNKNIK